MKRKASHGFGTALALLAFLAVLAPAIAHAERRPPFGNDAALLESRVREDVQRRVAPVLEEMAPGQAELKYIDVRVNRPTALPAGAAPGFEDLTPGTEFVAERVEVALVLDSKLPPQFRKDLKNLIKARLDALDVPTEVTDSVIAFPTPRPQPQSPREPLPYPYPPAQQPQPQPAHAGQPPAPPATPPPPPAEPAAPRGVPWAFAIGLAVLGLLVGALIFALMAALAAARRRESQLATAAGAPARRHRRGQVGGGGCRPPAGGSAGPARGPGAGPPRDARAADGEPGRNGGRRGRAGRPGRRRGSAQRSGLRGAVARGGGAAGGRRAARPIHATWRNACTDAS